MDLGTLNAKVMDKIADGGIGLAVLLTYRASEKAGGKINIEWLEDQGVSLVRFSMQAFEQFTQSSEGANGQQKLAELFTKRGIDIIVDGVDNIDYGRLVSEQGILNIAGKLAGQPVKIYSKNNKVADANVA